MSASVSKFTWSTALLLFLVVGVGPFLLEHWHGESSAKMRAALEDEYRAAAVRGEVVEPAPAANSVQAFARCGNGIPCFVRVKTASGEIRAYSKDREHGFKDLGTRPSPM